MSWKAQQIKDALALTKLSYNLLLQLVCERDVHHTFTKNTPPLVCERDVPCSSRGFGQFSSEPPFKSCFLFQRAPSSPYIYILIL
jgi:hypothetical protein